MAKREIVSAAEHFSMIRASRCKAGAPGGGGGGSLPGPPHLPGQTTIQVRVPYRVVGLVVGPKGATIKRIQQQTHTYIVTPSREKDPVFEVTGMPENVDRAREEIETHITLRTGTFVDLQGDNDFHSNGTDVSLEGLGALAGGLGASLWSRATGHHSAPPPPPPSPPPPIPMSMHHSSGRKMSSSVAYHTHNGGMSSDSFNATRKANEGGSPTSPFSTGSSSAGGGFTFGGDSTPGLPSSEELGFEFSASNIWAPFVNGGTGNKTAGSSQQQQPLRRNSSGLSGWSHHSKIVSNSASGHRRGPTGSSTSPSCPERPPQHSLLATVRQHRRWLLLRSVQLELRRLVDRLLLLLGLLPALVVHPLTPREAAAAWASAPGC
ncbi:RNA-binding protein MEX3D [Larimichthys crocea]|uniref:Uncharacterized protein n=1 Tax=Larimichthys crocea TaxID=215358 RepID=A0ACD3QRY8_LARCR|nr:RNA-binding protein MEX3D [Larimichthys crocea]